MCAAGPLGRLPRGVDTGVGLGLSREDSRDCPQKGRASGEHQPGVHSPMLILLQVSGGPLPGRLCQPLGAGGSAMFPEE